VERAAATRVTAPTGAPSSTQNLSKTMMASPGDVTKPVQHHAWRLVERPALAVRLMGPQWSGTILNGGPAGPGAPSEIDQYAARANCSLYACQALFPLSSSQQNCTYTVPGMSGPPKP
jgi:hypothetical protein